MTLTDARAAIAAALNTIDGLRVKPSGIYKNPRPNDGWVTLSRVEPSDFYGACLVSFEAVVVLGSDEAMAESRFEELAPEVIDAVTAGDLPPAAGVAVTPAMVMSGTGEMPALALSFTMEVPRA